MLLASLLLGLIYWAILWFYLRGWERTEVFRNSERHYESVAIIIPARNEAANIGACLESILANDYPGNFLQILVVNDYSTDETAQIARAYPNVQVIDLEDYASKLPTDGAYKKFGIEQAIRLTDAKIILQTDADCIVGQEWIQSAVNYLETTENICFTGVVHFYDGNALQRFQALDLAGMMQVTAAGLFFKVAEMGNGANMGYYRKAFLEVGGFSGVRKYASGDDVFLIQKLNERWPGQVGFLKHNDQAVFTHAPETWSAFWAQRLRWATKNGSYKKIWIPIILAIIFLYCNVLIVTLFLSLFYPLLFQVFLVLVLMKTVGDYFFLRNACQYFERLSLLRAYLQSQLFHIIYIFWIGWKSVFVKEYQWKNRKVR